MKPKIVVPNRIEDDILEKLRQVGTVQANSEGEPLSPEALRHQCRDAAALMAFMTETIDAEFLTHCPNLRIVAGALKGFDNLDIAACTARGVQVTIVPDLLTADERAWFDAYHARVRAEIGPLVEGEVRAWLDAATEPLQ